MSVEELHMKTFCESYSLIKQPTCYKNPDRPTCINLIRGGSRTAATSKTQHFVIIVNGFQLLTITTKRSVLNVAAVLDPPLLILTNVPRNFQSTCVFEKD